ncbi:glycoside hydrolase family 73 protein [Peptostreptococcus faecalis]|uniref:glycoside hydrolase family 73 protein n=1 Tax=Peptostreptococcus faecalis TaxID=2045015 RepID=UPI000C7E4564|nr:glucosaminidase domain-containing protein [Peptostreptococcus faecalis]
MKNTPKSGTSNKKNKIRTKSSPKKKKKNRLKKIIIAVVIVFVLNFLYTVSKVFYEIDSSYTMKSSSSKSDFIEKIEEVSINEYRRSGILPSITISQAILESNWGRSKLTIDANNLFGIKADAKWSGEKVKFKTKENYNDYEKAYFRKYKSWEESIRDHTDFLLKNSRYVKAGIFKKEDYINQAQSLEDAGYATTINEKGEKIYADKLISIIKSNNLHEIDKKVKGTLN